MRTAARRSAGSAISHGQLCEHRGHLVVVGAALGRRAYRHGHHRSDRTALDGLAAPEQQVAEPAGDHGEHDVVDSAAVLGADGLDVGEASARPRPAAVRPDRPVERDPRRRAQQRAQARDGARDLGRLAHRPARVARRRPQAARALVRACRPVGQRRADDAWGARLRRRLPRRDLGGRRPALVVEDHAQQVRARDTVDHAVVQLVDQRPAAVAEALRDPHLPQRLRAVELLRHHAADEVAQLRVAARRGQRRAPHVVLEVEVARRRPRSDGRARAAGSARLPIARDQVELGRDRGEDRVLLRRRTLEDAHRADVHVTHRVLHVQERGIERAHRLHATSMPHRLSRGSGRRSASPGERSTTRSATLPYPRPTRPRKVHTACYALGSADRSSPAMRCARLESPPSRAGRGTRAPSPRPSTSP